MTLQQCIVLDIEIGVENSVFIISMIVQLTVSFESFWYVETTNLDYCDNFDVSFLSDIEK